MQASIEVARPDDESQDIALWRSCNLVTQPNDPGMDFRFALPVRHVLRSGFRGCHRTGLRKRQGRPWRQPGLALLRDRNSGRGTKASGARWVRPAHTGCAHHVPGGQIMLRPQTMVPPFMHISAMKACHVSPWANGACGRADLATASATRVLVPPVHGPWFMHQRPE